MSEISQTELLSFMDSLDKASNTLGSLTPDVRARLYAVVENPTQETWNDAYSLMVSEEQGITLWQAVVRYGNYKVYRREAGEPWPQIPTREAILRGLALGTIPFPFGPSEAH